MTDSATDARTAPVAVWRLLEAMSQEERIAWRIAPIDNAPTAAERNLDIGFPFGWYPILLSDELAVGEVKPLRFFSTELAVWRGEDGAVRMVDAYCRHLGAHMGHGGKVSGNLLECPFHSWRYDGEEGVVKEIPYAKVMPPQVKRKCTRTWHIREANRMIWMWYHPHDVAPLFDVVDIAEATDPNWTDFQIEEWTIYGSIQNMAENGVDFAHFKYIHGTANVPMGELDWGNGYDRSSVLKVKLGTPRGEIDGAITTASQGPGQNWVRFTGICETLLLALITPIEHDRLSVRYLYTQPKTQAEGPAAGVARAIIADVNKQLDQDKVIWDRMRYEPNPIICDGDGPIPRFRKFYSRYYADAATANR